MEGNVPMLGGRCTAVGSLLAATILLQTAGAAFAGDPPGPADNPGTIPETTQATVDRAKDLAQQACATAATSAKARDASGTVAETARAAANEAACLAAQDNGGKEQASFSGLSNGIASEPAVDPLPDTHQTANNLVKSDNLQWISNSRGTNGNFAGANFIHYENLGYDFLFGDGTGGLSIWSLKDPAKPLYVAAVPATALMMPADPHHGRNHDCFSATPPCPAGTVE